MAKENIREFRRHGGVSEVRNIGALDDDFRKADIPTGRELGEDEKKMFFRKKKFAKVTISVKAESGDAETSSVIDEFNLHVVSEKHSPNVKTVELKLESLKPLLNKLVENWEKEV